MPDNTQCNPPYARVMFALLVLVDPLLRRFREYAVTRLQLNPGDQVLDVAVAPAAASPCSTLPLAQLVMLLGSSQAAISRTRHTAVLAQCACCRSTCPGGSGHEPCGRDTLVCSA